MTSHVIAYRSTELLFCTHTFNFNCFFDDFNCVFTQIRCLSRLLHDVPPEIDITLGLTIVAKNDYCDSIDIAGSGIAILLLLWTTIAIIL